MVARFHVIGSGASGVHFALSLLERGYAVTMLDVGHGPPPVPAPELTLNGLKDTLDDPSDYFLGSDFHAVLLPGTPGEYYALPPSKDHVFEAPDRFATPSHGFAPLFSFASGGLAEAWTGGCYPLTEGELADFPFSRADIAPHYDEIARRVGVSGAADDDLARFLPAHAHLLPGLRLDDHSAALMASYARVRTRLNGEGVYLGRTRVATLTEPKDGREACAYAGRCLWGCPRRALYTPSLTLARCREYSRFEYRTGLEVLSLTVGAGRHVRSVVARPVGEQGTVSIPCDQVALAAGTLMSSKIFLATHARETGTRVRLAGLMDNRQVLVPFLNLARLGARFSADAYQFHLLGLGLETGDPRTYVHGQITTLKTALLHPLAQRLPLDLRTSTAVLRGIHGALGLVNLNFNDTRRPANSLQLVQDGDEGQSRLTLRYAALPDEPARIREALARVRRALWHLNCVIPPGLVHVRPMGASVHYAGTVPMTHLEAPLTTDPACRSRDYGNLYLVDGATFPFLPAKNLTLTLMANAARVATLV